MGNDAKTDHTAIDGDVLPPLAPPDPLGEALKAVSEYKDKVRSLENDKRVASALLDIALIGLIGISLTISALKLNSLKGKG